MLRFLFPAQFVRLEIDLAAIPGEPRGDLIARKMINLARPGLQWPIRAIDLSPRR